MKHLITILLLFFAVSSYSQINTVKVSGGVDTLAMLLPYKNNYPRQAISLVFTTTGSSGAATGTYNSNTGVFTVNIPQYSGGSGGITSINSQTGAAQTFTIGTAGTDFNVTSNSDTTVYNLPTASGTNRGVITSTMFNNFLSAFLNTTDSATFQPKYRSDTNRVNVYSALNTHTSDIATNTSNIALKLDKAGDAYTTTTGNGLDITSSTLTTGTLAALTITGTAAASNTKKAFSITSSGANATASQTVTGQTISVTNTGTTNKNIGLVVTASGASATNGNIAATFDGNVGIGTTTPDYKLKVVTSGKPGMWLTTTSGDAAQPPFYFTDASFSSDLEFYLDNTNVNIGPYANKGIQFVKNAGANPTVVIDNTGRMGIGTTSPTAVLHIKAGTATANTAPIKLTSGTSLTTPEAGAMEYNGTSLFFTPAATRQTIAFTDLAQTFSAGQTFSVNMIINGGFQTSSVGVSSSNLFSGSGSLSSGISQASYITNGNNLQTRVGIRGSTSTVATAGSDVFALAIGDNVYTEALSGTSALAGGLYVKTQSFTNGSGATTDFQNAYIGDAPTGATNNWALNTGSTLIREKLSLSTGSNKSVGTATLSSGTVTISTTAVTSSSLIFVVYDTPSGTLASGLSAPVGSIVNGTSFVINSLTTAGVVNTLDNSTVRYWVIN